MPRPRINVYISPEAAKLLTTVSAQRRASKASIVDAALAAFLSPQPEEPPQTALLKRLDRIDKQIDRLEEDLEIASETLALFIQYFMIVTPAVSDRDRAAAQAKGRERFDGFLRQVAKRIASGQMSTRDILMAAHTTEPEK